MTTVDWASLRHAYGPADDIPPLLARARTAPPPTDYRSEPWFTLWSSLYHQDDIYSASYAAVPELVDLAAECEAGIAAESLFLAASIELRRHEPGAPDIPSTLRADYERAVAAARPLAADLARRAPDSDGKLVVADTVFRGEFDRARALLDADDEEADE